MSTHPAANMDEELFDDIEDTGSADTVQPPVPTVESVTADLIELETLWLLKHEQNAVDQLTAIYAWDTPSYSAADASSTFESAASLVCQLQAAVKFLGDAMLMPRVVHLMRSVQESYHLLTALSAWSGHESSPAMLADDLILRFETGSTDKDSPLQLVYQFILEWCMRLELRHKDDVVYKQIISRGRKTHAWVPAKDLVNGVDVDSMEKLVAFICTKHRNRAMWLNWVTLSGSHIYGKLKCCREMEFPQLKTTRAWFAFRDGLYSVYNDCFIYYDDPRVTLPEELAACCYHNIDFAPAYLRYKRTGPAIPKCVPMHPLVELKTPLFDRIMDCQHLCRHTRLLLMAMVRRKPSQCLPACLHFKYFKAVANLHLFAFVSDGALLVR